MAVGHARADGALPCPAHPQVALGPDFTIGWDSQSADFAMTLGEFYCKGLTAPVMVEIKRDDVVFARVYDIRGQGSVSGVLTKVAFTNPHGAMYLDVQNADGTVTNWGFSGGAPGIAVRRRPA